MESEQQQIWETIQTMNRCWTGNDPEQFEKLNYYFYETMVAVTPTEKCRLEGRQACVDGWKAFAVNCPIHYWKERDPKIQIFGSAAVATYYFEISFDMGDNTMVQNGRDMMTLIKEDGRWKVVADQFSPDPSGD
jgi:ketosteroid isomerase-like protein